MMGAIKNSHSPQSSKFTISLKSNEQYLSIEIMNGVHLGVHQDHNFYKLDYRLLMKAARQKKRKFVKFCNILRKSIVATFVFYCDAKHSDTLRGSGHVCC